MKKCVIYDVETTGLNKETDRIIQFSAIRVDLDTNEVLGKINTYIKPDMPYKISPGAYFKHHISNDMLDDKKTFSEQANDILEFLGDDTTAIMTYNGLAFDNVMLRNEFKRCGIDLDFSKRDCYDIFKTEKRRNSNSLEDTYKRYTGVSMDENNLEAHDALSDVMATYEIYKKQNEQKEVKPENMFGDDGIIEMMKFNGRDLPCFAIGKYRTLPVILVNHQAVDPEYIKWCLNNNNFSNSTKEAIKKIISA